MKEIHIKWINPNYEVEIMEYVRDTCDSFKEGIFAETEAEAYGYFLKRDLFYIFKDKCKRDLLPYIDINNYVCDLYLGVWCPWKDKCLPATKEELKSMYEFATEANLDMKFEEYSGSIREIYPYLSDSYIEENVYSLYGLIDIPEEIGGGFVAYRLENDFFESHGLKEDY